MFNSGHISRKKMSYREKKEPGKGNGNRKLGKARPLGRESRTGEIKFIEKRERRRKIIKVIHKKLTQGESY